MFLFELCLVQCGRTCSAAGGSCLASSGFKFSSPIVVQTPPAGDSLVTGGDRATGNGFGVSIGGTEFGQTRDTGFGASAGQTGSLFGTKNTSSLLGQTSVTGAFGGASASIAAVGTTVPFNPPNGQDTMIKNGVNTNINTKHQCITAMKEYENASLEELRMEDYSINRKSRHVVSTSTVGLFGQTPSTLANAGFVFGGGLGSGLHTSTAGFGTSSGFGGISAFGVPTPLAGGSLFGDGVSGTTGGGFFGSVGGTGFGQTQNASGFSFGANAHASGTGFGARSGGFRFTVMQQLKEQNNQLRERTMCKICKNKEVAVVFLPCRHFVSCTNCAARQKDCPVCRNVVRRRVRACMA